MLLLLQLLSPLQLQSCIVVVVAYCFVVVVAVFVVGNGVVIVIAVLLCRTILLKGNGLI
jgi:hypothetical protein